MKKVLFAIAVGALLVAACNKEQEAPQPITKKVTLKAAAETFNEVGLNGITKGSLDTEGSFLWASGDQIGVRLYKGTAYNGKDSGSNYDAWDGTFTLDDGYDGQAQGSFSSSSNLDEYVHWGYAAFYPKFANNVNNSDGKVYFELKKVYENYTSGTCLMPMVANMNIAPDGLNGRPSQMSFKHVGAGIRVTLKDVPGEANQASLTVAGKNIANGDNYTAWFGINPANAGTDYISATDGNGENTVYLKFATATEKRDITFIFPLPTVDLSGGITLKLYYGNSYTEFWSKTASTLPALTRGQLLDMPDVTVPVTPEEAAAPIWIDGKISDWSTVTHTTTTSSNRILEWKYTQDDNNLYFLYKIDASKITADDSGSYKWGSYIYIGFDTDNDATKGKDGSGGLGGGMEYRAVVFPWRGTSETSLGCYIGEDTDGHIDDLLNTTTSSVYPKVGAKIVGSYCYVEVRIPRSTIGSPSGPITVKHAMNYYPTDAKQIMPEKVSINASDQSVGAGQTIDIGATANSVNPITYVSNDETIATVDANGVITGVAEGSTTITLSVAAVAGEYSAASKTINVEVTTPYVPAININGDLSDWDGIAVLPSSNSSRIREWKFKSDSRNVYFYFKLRKNRSYLGKHLVMGFNIDNTESTGYAYDSNKILGLEAQVTSDPFTNASGAEPVCYNGFDTTSEVKGNGVGTFNGIVSVWGYDAGESLDSDNSSTYVELSIPREKLNLPAAGSTITIGCSFDYYVTGTQSITLE